MKSCLILNSTGSAFETLWQNTVSKKVLYCCSLIDNKFSIAKGVLFSQTFDTEGISEDRFKRYIYYDRTTKIRF